jgi:hypothetical protein
MLFYKTISNYLKREKQSYDSMMNRRRDRFIELIKLNAPKEIINLEIHLLLQPFHLHVLRNILYKVRMQVSKTREIII